MTGTPTGEMLFFPNIKHIKVIKEDVRIKTCTVHTYPYKLETFYNMCRMMADDIIEGKNLDLYSEMYSLSKKELLQYAKVCRIMSNYEAILDLLTMIVDDIENIDSVEYSDYKDMVDELQSEGDEYLTDFSLSSSQINDDNFND